jgi:hypothetical protein
MAVAHYQQVLPGIDEGRARTTQRLRSAQKPSVVGSAAALAQNRVFTDIGLLAGVTPLAPLKAAQAALISALRQFHADLDSTASAASADQVCAGSSAIAMISRSRGAAQLRSADAQLQSAEARLATASPAAGSQMGAFLPPATADTNRRLANGTLVKRPTRTGLGELTIDNGGNRDAVVELVLSNGNVAVMAVYCRAWPRHGPATRGAGDYLQLSSVLATNV